jgi:hypothetical protein
MVLAGRACHSAKEVWSMTELLAPDDRITRRKQEKMDDFDVQTFS